MRLIIDVGNTNVKLGVFKDNKLVKSELNFITGVTIEPL